MPLRAARLGAPTTAPLLPLREGPLMQALWVACAALGAPPWRSRCPGTATREDGPQVTPDPQPVYGEAPPHRWSGRGRDTDSNQHRSSRCGGHRTPLEA